MRVIYFQDIESAVEESLSAEKLLVQLNKRRLYNVHINYQKDTSITPCQDYKFEYLHSMTPYAITFIGSDNQLFVFNRNTIESIEILYAVPADAEPE